MMIPWDIAFWLLAMVVAAILLAGACSFFFRADRVQKRRDHAADQARMALIRREMFSQSFHPRADEQP